MSRYPYDMYDEVLYSNSTMGNESCESDEDDGSDSSSMVSKSTFEDCSYDDRSESSSMVSQSTSLYR